MKLRGAFSLPSSKVSAVHDAVLLEWISLALLAFTALVMGLVMGSSQAMKSAWTEDLLSLIPPASFLIAQKFQNKKPTQKFPFGFRRASSIAFLVSAVVLTCFGALLFTEAARTLISQEHPTISSVEILGHEIWQGWLMIGVLIYSFIPPFFLGRAKEKLAIELHDEVLHTDARMNKADWMTAGAGVFGILGIGFGLWWADAAAAAIISFEILRDGVSNLKKSVLSLMDRSPTKVENEEEDPAIETLRSAIAALEWVESADVRLREEGDVLTGVIFVEPKTEDELMRRLAEAKELAHHLEWRLYDVVVAPVFSESEERRRKAKSGEARAGIVASEV